ncbi:ABC transporter ATP-binding protein [Synoicihabitans lomoniglobus]|uniref:ATP-binding cassette domain-containing protein n=1 Tax=Synoicihabitans lomoniglobus TaxID=2909285 RepID=A0AAE9ZXT8_9BACT|nr:ATP-binding cassette domain-containing protein [Opitutaceae bacterium LMO-M01]WED65289.1 ATP-binding cassette domain-containing protein [Opitutaceae bacterium LMO-M01]
MNTSPAQDHALPAIVAEDLAVGYDGVPLMEHLDFSIAKGEVFFVIGGSGCGKSTLLRHLIGLQQPIAGDVRIFGESFVKADSERRRQFLKTFGVLYQSSALWSSLTLAENITLPLEEYTDLNKRERAQLARLKLAQVGLTGYADYYPAEISGGMKKRAGLARALSLDPDIVFFDEPSAGLDPITSREMDELILQVRDTYGTTCVIVSHELASIFAIGDRVILLDKQARSIIATGPPKELASTSRDPRVLEFLHRGDVIKPA